MEIAVSEAVGDKVGDAVEEPVGFTVDASVGTAVDSEDYNLVGEPVRTW